ncbi:unnamed protein product [Hapterophycus canaliculatus]
MSCRYPLCLSYNFAPWHPEVLRQLPRDLVMLFPAISFRHSAVDKKIPTRIEQALVRGVGIKAVADTILENHLLHIHELEARYYFRMARRRDKKQGSFLPTENEVLRNPPVFGRWDDPLGYNGRCPGGALLTQVWYTVFEGQEQWYHRRAQLVDGQILAGDESHKLTKNIKVSNAKVFTGLYTVVNEFNQVVLQVCGCDPIRVK